MKVGDCVTIIRDNPGGVSKGFIGKRAIIVEDISHEENTNRFVVEFVPPIIEQSWGGKVNRRWYDEHELKLCREYNIKKLLEYYEDSSRSSI